MASKEEWKELEHYAEEWSDGLREEEEWIKSTMMVS